MAEVRNCIDMHASSMCMFSSHDHVDMIADFLLCVICRYGQGSRGPMLIPIPPSTSSLFQSLTAAASSSAAGSLDPWASPPQPGGDSSASGKRSRNSSAAFNELARLRSQPAPDAQ